MAQSGTTSQGREAASPGQLLRAQLAVEPHPESRCAVVEAGHDATDVTQQLKTGTSSRGPGSDDHRSCDECHAEVSFSQDADRERAYLKSGIGEHCICPVFERHDCIPEIEAVRAGALLISLTVHGRDALRDVIAELRTRGATVSVDWLVSGDGADSTMEMDVSTITDKQREAMETAEELGYYDTPRSAELGEVAAELGVSESAASQRLNAAETKLVNSFLER